MTKKLSAAVACLLGMVSLVEAQVTEQADRLSAYGNHMEAGGGVIGLLTDGDYVVDLHVVNRCGWPQSAYVGVRGLLAFVLELAPGESKQSGVPIRPETSAGAGGSTGVDLYRVEVRHPATTQGNKRCKEVRERKTLPIKWVSSRDNTGLRGQPLFRTKARILMVVTLQQEEFPAAEPAAAANPLEFPSFTVPNASAPIANPFDTDPPDTPVDPEPPAPTEPTLSIDTPAPAPPAITTTATPDPPTTMPTSPVNGPYRPIEGDNGRFVLHANGYFDASFVVDNRCDWDQMVEATFRGDSKNGVRLPAKSVSEFKVFFSRYARSTEVEVIRFELVHDEDAEGNKVCQRATKDVTLEIHWTDQAPGDAVPDAGILKTGGTIVLVQTDRNTGLPAATTTATTPDPAPTTPVSAADTAPDRSIEGENGRFVLHAEGYFDARFMVDNRCDWDQMVEITFRGDSKNGLRLPAKSLSEFKVFFSRSARSPEVEIIRFELVHEADVEGNRICERATRDAIFELHWVGQTPGNTVPKAGIINTGVTIVLVQRGTDTPAVPPTTPASPMPPATAPDPPTGDLACTGGDCFDFDACATAGACDPASLIPSAPNVLIVTVQIIGGELPPLLIQPSSGRAGAEAASPGGARRWSNPLGLLAKSAAEFIAWWMPAVHAAEPMSLEQAGRLPGGLQFLVTSRGGSTGKNLAMQVLNTTGRPIRMQGMLALEPIKADVQKKASEAFAKIAGRQIPSQVDLSGYCLEFLKLPPAAGQMLRVAGPEVQKRFAPMKQVMSAANRLKVAGRLRPDSNPETYGDSIKQWAIWTVEQKFTQGRFVEAFLSHTRKNVEGAGQKWSKQVEDAVRERIPNRWQDVVAILQEAGAAVPR